LVPISGEELEVFLTAASTDFWSVYLGKFDLLGTSRGSSSTLAMGIFPVEPQIFNCLFWCKGWGLEFSSSLPRCEPIVGAFLC
jgi:hypothetical protein